MAQKLVSRTHICAIEKKKGRHMPSLFLPRGGPRIYQVFDHDNFYKEY